MDYLEILPEALKILQKNKFEKENLFLDHIDPPIMIECDFRNGIWEKPQLVPYHNLSLDTATKVLHYAQGVFEGMKAYNVDNYGPLLFRQEENYKRFIKSFIRLDIPEIPKEFFMESLEEFVKHSLPFIPEETRHSLYLRPFVIATENGLGATSAKEFKFMIIGKIFKPCFNQSEGVPVYLERKYGRVGKGCTGSVKAISNYASAMKTDREAQDNGYKISLWLDSNEGRYIEELSGMNFFCVIDDIIYTPSLNDSILPGITRDSIITLARSIGIEVVETDIEINELTLLHLDSCSEMFACGTMATVMPIAYLGEEDGTCHYPKFSVGPITTLLLDKCDFC